MPLISVIVPVYKVEPYLRRCVDSILAQTFSDFELILVDDGSPDDCGAICDEYAEKDFRIRVIHQKNGGLSAARNTGIDWAFANSDSQWLTFIDSDDWVHEKYLELLYHALVSTNAGASVCIYTRVTPSGEILDSFSSHDKVEIIPYDQYFSLTGWGISPYVAWGKLYPKECFFQIRYPIGRITEDLFTTHKLLFGRGQIARVNTALYYYFQSEVSIMRNQWNPKRLDEVQASELLILFMHQHGCKVAERTAITRYLWVLRNQISQIEKVSDPSYESYKKQLIRKGKKLLLKYRTRCFPFAEYQKAYEQFLPQLTRIRLAIGRVFRRFRRTVK